MGWAEDAKFVIFGRRGSTFSHTERALGDMEMGDLDYPTRGVNSDIRNSNPHYNGSNRNKLLKTLADLRLEVFSVRQIASQMRADPVQIQDIVNELEADGVLERVPNRRGVYAFAGEMKKRSFNPPPDRSNSNPFSQNPYRRNDDSIEALKKLIEEQLFVLNKKIDFWASRIQSSNDIERKKKAPNAVISEFKGKIMEIVNTLKVIEMPGSDRELGDLILQYKDARREGLIAKERDLGYEVVDRLDAMVSVYLHLTRSFNEFNKYLLDLYREGVIKDFDEGNQVGGGYEGPAPIEQQPQQPPPRPRPDAQQKLPSQRAPPRPPPDNEPPRPSPQQSRVPNVEGEEESEDIQQFDEGEGEFADEELDNNV